MCSLARRTDYYLRRNRQHIDLFYVEKKKAKRETFKEFIRTLEKHDDLMDCSNEWYEAVSENEYAELR